MATPHISRSDEANSAGLIRALGLWSATALVIGSMIGQAVFLVASDMSRDVGSAAKVLAAWIIGGVVVLLGALCYAELGAAIPETGGDYVYLSRGLGALWGFLFGWTSSIIARPGSCAVIATGLSRFAESLSPGLAHPIINTTFRLTGTQLLAAAVIALVTGLNYLGVRTGGRFQVVLTTLKIVTLAAVLSLVLVNGNSGAQSDLSDVAFQSGAGAFLTALVPVMAAYNGFQYVAAVGGEIVNPRRSLPIAGIIGTSLVITLYVLVNWAYFHALGFSQVAQSRHVASDAVTLVFGSAAGRWFTIAMVISAFGTLHAGFLTGPRIPYAMARDNYFFSFANRVQPTFRTPSGALLFQGAIAILLVLTGTYQELYSYTMFAIWIFLAFTAVALIRLRAKEPELPRPFRVWGYPWTVLLFGAASLLISVNLWRVRPLRSSIGLGIILLGIPLFRFWHNRLFSTRRSL